MKKIIATTVILLVAGFTMNAQDISKNALGLRLGDNDGFGGEISYQARLSSSHRLELDLGWRDGKNYNGYKLSGLHQWVMPIEDRFNWYVVINDTVLERIKSVAGVLRARKRDSSAGWMVYLVMDKSKDAFVVERDILEILAPLQVGMGG